MRHKRSPKVSIYNIIKRVSNRRLGIPEGTMQQLVFIFIISNYEFYKKTSTRVFRIKTKNSKVPI
jgi:hypothetical protein